MLTTDELKLFADLLDERGTDAPLVDRIRHEIATRENTEPQINTLVDGYGATILTRWPFLKQAWEQEYGLRAIMMNVAVDSSCVGHTEGHRCSRGAS